MSLPPPLVSFVPCITPLSTSHISGGEQYAVNCPFCGDTRHRLYISHMWNQIIETSNHVKYHCSKHLIRCFNEDCQRKEENFNQLCEKLIHVMKNPQVIRLADVQTVELQTNLTTIKIRCRIRIRRCRYEIRVFHITFSNIWRTGDLTLITLPAGVYRSHGFHTQFRERKFR